MCRDKARLEGELQAAGQQLEALRGEAEAGWAAERKLRGLDQAADARAEEAQEVVRDLRRQLEKAASHHESQVGSCMGLTTVLEQRMARQLNCGV